MLDHNAAHGQRVGEQDLLMLTVAVVVAVSAIINALTLAINVLFPQESRRNLQRTRTELERLVGSKMEQVLVRNEEDGEHVTFGDIHKTIVVKRVQLPKIDKHATGRKREGRYDLSLRNVDREAQCAFNGLSKMWKEESRSTLE